MNEAHREFIKKLAWIGRYTSYKREDVENFTVSEFVVFCEELSTILRKESGKDE